MAVGSIAIAEDATVPDKETKLKEMPLLTGNQWQKMSRDEKVAFVWGMGHVITLQRNSDDTGTAARGPSFISRMAEGISGTSMNSLVSTIDNFYENNRSKLDEPVIKVLWDAKVKKGAAGSDTPPAAR
jgi:hypothetical protein